MKMDRFRVNTIHAKLTLAVLLISLMVVLAGSYSLFVVKSSKRTLRDFEKLQVTQGEVHAAHRIQISVLAMRGSLIESALERNRNHLAETRRLLTDIEDNIRKIVRADTAEPDDLARIEEVKRQVNRMWETGSAMVQAYIDGNSTAAVEMKEFDTIAGNLVKSLGAYAEHEVEDIEEQARDIVGNSGNSVDTAKGFAVLLISLGILLVVGTVFVRRSITRPLEAIIEHVRVLATGDLTAKIHLNNSEDEVGQLARGIDWMTESLRSIAETIRKASDRVLEELGTLKGRSRETAMAAISETDHAHEINESLESMSTIIGDIAKGASTASQTASGAMSTASDGVTLAGEIFDLVRKAHTSTIKLAETVGKLNDRLTDIDKITVVINDIADQTNLLALNAAIEAARAGDHGRGFAVVADEVRKLAEKTISATREISTSLGTIRADSKEATSSMDEASNNVTRASESIEKVREAMSHTVESIQTASDQITQIAVAVEEQSSTSATLVANIQETSDVSRKMEDRSEEVMAQISLLANIAESLKESVYALNTGTASSGPPARGEGEERSFPA